MNILVLVIVGIAAGYLAGMLWKGRGFGFLGNLAVGIAGSFLGRFLLSIIGFSIHGIIAQVVAAVIGAMLLLWIVNKLR